MKIPISKLSFSLPDQQLDPYIKRIDKATKKIKEIQRASGTGSRKFKDAFSEILIVLKNNGNLTIALKTSLHLRALALLFNTEWAENIVLSQAVLQRVSSIRSKPGYLLIDAIYANYLKQYDKLSDVHAVEKWLIDVKSQRKILTKEKEKLLGGNGPKWLAEKSHLDGVDFDEQSTRLGLDRYQNGRFMTVAKNIYYLEVLRGLKPDELDPILDEMQKPSVYESRYDENALLGHLILKILIEKAPDSGVVDGWMNIILTIAGDPRVALSNPNYIK